MKIKEIANEGNHHYVNLYCVVDKRTGYHNIPFAASNDLEAKKAVLDSVEGALMNGDRKKFIFENTEVYHVGAFSVADGGLVSDYRFVCSLASFLPESEVENA